MYRTGLMGYNKKNMPKENNPQEKAKHKRELLEQMAKRNRHKKEEKKTNTNQVSSSEIKKYKKQIEGYKKQFNTEQNKNTKLRKDNREIKQENYDLKRENKEVKSAKQALLDDSQKREADLQSQIDYLNRKLEGSKDLENWFKTNKLDSPDSIKKQVSDLTQQAELISLLFQVQTENSRHLSGQLEYQNNYAIHQENEIAKQHTLINLLNSEKKSLSNDIIAERVEKKKLQDYIDRQLFLQSSAPDKLINMLMQKLNADNIDRYFNLHELVNKYNQVLDNVNPIVQEAKYRYGYVMFTEDGYSLHDINTGEIVPVEVDAETASRPQFVPGRVIRAYYEGNKWILDRSYFTSNWNGKPEQTAPASIKKKPKKQTKSKENEHAITITDPVEISWASGQDVLVIGNKFSSGFIDELKKYCNVTVKDAYEDGLQQIFNAMHSADYVFLLVGSVPHAVTEYMKTCDDLAKGSTKVQVFDTPAKYDGVARLHYLFSMM